MKKKIVSVFVIVTLLTVQCFFAVSANDGIVDSGDCGLYTTWTLDTNGMLTISGSGAIASRMSYSELPWYSHISEIKSVVINNGVTGIGSYAFYGCKSLKSVSIPASITVIGDYAFSGCTGLTGVYITDIAAWCRIQFSVYGTQLSNPLSYAKNLYLNNELVTDLVIPDGVTSISKYAFQGCKSLTSVSIPDGVTRIEGYTFSDCSNLKEVKIPDSVTSIGSDAFRKCTNLKSITIPAGVTSISSYVFSNCTGLTEINVDKSNENYASIDGVLMNKDKTEIVQYPLGKTGPYVIPDGVTEIYGYTFSDCIGLTSVTIPANLTGILFDPFSDCIGLTEINVDKNNENYSSVDGVLMNKDKTEIVRYPLGKTGAYTIPDSVTNIDSETFSGCSNLTSVNIHSGVTSINSEAFSDCTGLTEINVDENNENYASVGGVLMNKDKTQIIRYPMGKTGAYTIPSGVTSIGDSAFSDCVGLTDVTIPAGVTSIGDSAFSDCVGLTDVIIPDNVTNIGARAFSGCSALTVVTIPASVTSIGSYVFSFCSSLTKINVDENNKNYVTDNGALIDKRRTAIVQFPAGKTGFYAIPDGITSIGAGAFYGCSDLKGVKIPDSVMSIGPSAFKNCNSLTSVIIPDGVEYIEYNTFFNCNNLRYVSIPDSVISIESSVFSHCDELTDVYYSGSWWDWDKIGIETDNETLEFVVVHYNSAAPAPALPAVVEITKSESDTEYVFTVTPVELNENCLVYGTVYGADGKLLTCSAKGLEIAGSTTIGVKKSDNIRLVKAFVWTENMQPIAVEKIDVN